MTTSERRAPDGATMQLRRQSKLNRWDSPWLNPKFLIGLAMVLSVILLGVVGPLFWEERLSYPASSPLNLPPPWAPGFDSETDKPIV